MLCFSERRATIDLVVEYARVQPVPHSADEGFYEESVSGLVVREASVKAREIRAHATGREPIELLKAIRYWKGLGCLV